MSVLVCKWTTSILFLPKSENERVWRLDFTNYNETTLDMTDCHRNAIKSDIRHGDGKHNGEDEEGELML
jgi:hypothetical protein